LRYPEWSPVRRVTASGFHVFQYPEAGVLTAVIDQVAKHFDYNGREDYCHAMKGGADPFEDWR